MSATVSGHFQFGNEDQGQVVPGTYVQYSFVNGILIRDKSVMTI
jgi:hypothetical protein